MLITQPSILLRRLRDCMSSTQSCCCMLASVFPKVFCNFLLVWTFYIFSYDVVQKNVIPKKGPVVGVIIWLIGAITCFLTIYTYYKVVSAGPGSPLDFDSLKIANVASLMRSTDNPYEEPNQQSSLIADSDHHHQQGENNSIPPEQPPEFLNCYTVKFGSAFRYCPKCSCWKPDRCHHCSSCNRCVLKMDHHCPWFATCIGFKNGKYFIQVLFYLLIYSFVVFFFTAYVLWNFVMDAEYEDDYLSVSLVLTFAFSIAFFISIAVFLGFSVWLASKNVTTIEMNEQRWRKEEESTKFKYEFGDKKNASTNIFDLGWRKNLTSVLGESWLEWLLPIPSSKSPEYANGFNFEINRDAYERWYQDSQLQEQLNQQMHDYITKQRQERQVYN